MNKTRKTVFVKTTYQKQAVDYNFKTLRNEIWALAIICDPEIPGLMFYPFQITTLDKYF